MSRIEIIEERCKGCLLCTEACPKKLITQSSKFNKQGYKVAEVKDHSKCTACASCGITCPDAAIVVYRTKKGA